MVCHASVLPGCEHSRCGNPEMLSPQCSQWHSTPQACIDHLLRYSILDVSSVYRNGIEKRYSIEVPTAPRTYRACIESVSNKKCLDTVSRGVYRKSRYTYDTLRYTSIHFDTFMGKMHPDTWGKRPYFPLRRCQRLRSCAMQASRATLAWRHHAKYIVYHAHAAVTDRVGQPKRAVAEPRALRPLSHRVFGRHGPPPRPLPRVRGRGRIPLPRGPP